MQKVFEAISDPNRRKILHLLKSGDKSVSELSTHFDITGASLSHHLNKLKSADLVVSERQGQSIYYSINTSVFDDATQFIVNFFQNQGDKKK